MSQESTSKNSLTPPDKHSEHFLASSTKYSRWQEWLPYALLISITFSLYAESLYYHFVWDDLAYVLENDRIRQLSYASLRRIWTEPYFSQYAPIHLSFLAVVYSVADFSAFHYHLSQLLLHGGCVCLLYFVLKRILPLRVALLATLLFAVYPPNVEVVAWVSQTKTTLSFLFFLVSFWAFLRHVERGQRSDGLICALFLVLSLTAKISTVVAPAVFLAYAYSQRPGWNRSNQMLLIGFLFPISMLFAGVHLATTRTLVTPGAALLFDSAILDATLPLVDMSSSYIGGFYTHLLNMPRLLFFYLRMVVAPFPLSAWHMFRLYGELNWHTGAAWIGVILLCWALYRSPRQLQFWQLWFYLFLLPVLQFIPNPIWVADRYLYVPAVGAFVLISAFFYYLADRVSSWWVRWSMHAAMGTALLALAWLTHAYLPLWRNDLTLWRATAKGCPTSAYCHHAFGNSLFINGYSRLAIPELYRAVQIRQDPSYLVDLGDAYALGVMDYARALLAYRMATQVSSYVPLSTKVKIARAYYQSGQIAEADKTIAEAERTYAVSVDLLVVKAFVLGKQGRLDDARRSIQHAIRLADPPTSAAQLLKTYWPNPEEAGRLFVILAPF